jgi:nicotinate-nucleotide adenylyltransferase
MNLHIPLEFLFDEDVEGHLKVRIIDEKSSSKKFITLFEACHLSRSDQCIILDHLSRSFKFMKSTDTLNENELQRTYFYYKLLEELPERVTFFGGTFDPFHQGHVACIELTPEDSIIVMPDYNPFKDHLVRLSPLEDFLKICLSLKSISKASIYPGFLLLNEPNPTIDWFKNISIKEKNLIIGDDSFLNLHKWKSSQELLSICHKIYVVPRNHSAEEFEKQKISLLSNGTKTTIVRLPEHLFMNISSTEIRKNLV